MEGTSEGWKRRGRRLPEKWKPRKSTASRGLLLLAAEPSLLMQMKVMQIAPFVQAPCMQDTCCPSIPYELKRPRQGQSGGQAHSTWRQTQRVEEATQCSSDMQVLS